MSFVQRKAEEEGDVVPAARTFPELGGHTCQLPEGPHTPPSARARRPVLGTSGPRGLTQANCALICKTNYLAVEFAYVSFPGCHSGRIRNLLFSVSLPLRPCSQELRLSPSCVHSPLALIRRICKVLAVPSSLCSSTQC